MASDDEVIRLYRSGLSIVDTAAAAGVSKWKVEQITRGMTRTPHEGRAVSSKKLGRPGSPIAGAQIEEMVALYDGGMSARAIAKRFGLDHHRVTALLREATESEQLRVGGYSPGGLKPGAIKRKGIEGDSRICARCRIDKPNSEYGKDKNGPGGIHTYCRLCANEISRWQSKRKLYGLTREEYQAMVESQGGCCAICQGEFSDGRVPHVDHCHVTGRVRGLLCRNCNFAIGLMRDDLNTLKAAIVYLSV